MSYVIPNLEQAAKEFLRTIQEAIEGHNGYAVWAKSSEFPPLSYFETSM